METKSRRDGSTVLPSLAGLCPLSIRPPSTEVLGYFRRRFLSGILSRNRISRHFSPSVNLALGKGAENGQKQRFDPANCTLNPPNCTLNAPCCTLNTPDCTLNLPCCTLNPPRCTLNTPCCALNPPRCTLNPPRCALNTPRCARNLPRCALNTPRCVPNSSR